MNFLTQNLSMQCPTCGCPTVIRENVEYEFDSMKVRTHVNGERWESRTFLCGEQVRWVPNFSDEKVDGTCRNDAVKQHIARQRHNATVKLISSINKLDVDADWKDEMKKRVSNPLS